MNEPILLTKKQINRLRSGKGITISRNGEAIVIGRKNGSDKATRIKARIAALRLKLKEVSE